MEYYQKLNIKKKKEIEIEEEYIKNLDIEILKKETQFKDFKEKIEIKINVYQKEIENLKINKFEININELDSKIDCNNKNILNYEDKIESQNKDFIIQENNLEKEKEKKENEYQKELNNVDEQKHKISLLKKKKIVLKI